MYIASSKFPSLTVYWGVIEESLLLLHNDIMYGGTILGFVSWRKQVDNESSQCLAGIAPDSSPFCANTGFWIPLL